MLKYTSKADRIVSEVNLHINNGGVTYRVLDTLDGPVVEVEQSHFGAASTISRVKVKREVLSALVEMFVKASRPEEKYSADYATAPGVDSRWSDEMLASPMSGTTDCCALKEEER